MSRENFKLSRDDIARQIHYAIRELHPDHQLDGNIVHKMIIESGDKGTALIFPAGNFAEINGFEPKKFVRDLYRTLNLEMEKNLHDKFLFEILVDDNFIHFKLMD
ncbi:hypothetical protein TRIP_C21369 [Candidatus Zixiibacteriota bacterium]|nr:hypothetical protein TRIP_C21369 [candidate division Zixibacteria bacterium]